MKNKLCVLFLLLPFAAAAEEAAVSTTVEQPAREYAHGSVSVVGSASLGVALVGPSAIGSGLQTFALSGGLALRFVTKPGFTLEPRLTTQGVLVTGAVGLFALYSFGGGVGAGWAFALGRRVALTPMLSYELSVLGGGVNAGLGGLAHTGSLELPLTVFFTKSAFVELYARGGVSFNAGQLAPAFAAGYRFGVAW